MSGSYERVMTLQQRVKSYLLKDDKYRDSDEMLISRLWNDYLISMEYEPKTISAYDFLCLYATGQIPNSDAITRARRKLQEEFEYLRGKKWIERQKEADDFKKRI